MTRDEAKQRLVDLQGYAPEQAAALDAFSDEELFDAVKTLEEFMTDNLPDGEPTADYMAYYRKCREQLRAVARPEAVELFGDRIENPPEFVFLHALTSTSSF